MNDIPTALRSLARQEQFLDVVDRDTATARFHRHLKLRPLGAETVPLPQALGRVLAREVIADVDVPGFDRASVDGFAVRADDTVGASERAPKALALNGEILTPGAVPHLTVAPGTATLIATGGMVPRGAEDRKSTRLNSSHGYISYAVFCLKKKNLTQMLLRAATNLTKRAERK